MSSAIERLNRYEDKKLVLDDRQAGEIRINGVFNAGDSEAFVEALRETFGVRAEDRNGTFVLSRS